MFRVTNISKFTINRVSQNFEKKIFKILQNITVSINKLCFDFRNISVKTASVLKKKILILDPCLIIILLQLMSRYSL